MSNTILESNPSTTFTHHVSPKVCLDDLVEQSIHLPNVEREPPASIQGVVIGDLVAIGKSGEPFVRFSGQSSQLPVVARTTVALDHGSIGRKVALMFEDGNPDRPLLLGVIQTDSEVAQPLHVRRDDESLVLTADREIVLRCGEASITLTRAGKILIRGNYVLSRSSGVNRIKGGSVQIN